MASGGVRSNEFQANEELLPLNYHGLEIESKLKAHVEQFRVAKEEIATGKRRRRNSTSDCRLQATIEADGPDSRFNDIKIEESGLRDGLAATRFMPFYPNVQDFTRRSSRWEDLEQASALEDDKFQSSSSLDSLSDSDFPIKSRKNVNAAKQSTPPDSESTNMKTLPTTRRASVKATTGNGSTTNGIFYRCYAPGCKYQHARRSNFSIHWKRDAKHSGIFDLSKVLQCTRDQHGKITTTPYGNIKTHRQRLSLGTKDEVPVEEKHLCASSSEADDVVPMSRKRKAMSADSQKATRGASITGLGAEKEAKQQDSDSTSKELSAQSTQISSAHTYNSLECQIFRRLADVPTDFPAHLTPLITHGAPDSEPFKTSTTDIRFFCPECDKCFTQTHNVASHFSRHHGKQYSKNDRARTVCCRVTVSQNGVNIDAKPVDDTVLPRLQKIRLDRVQAPSSGESRNISASNTGIRSRKDDSPSLKSKSVLEPAKSLVTTNQTILPALLSSLPASPSPYESLRAQNLQQSSQRVLRMHAVRQSILARNSTNSSNIYDEQMAGVNTTGNTNEADSTTSTDTRNRNGRGQTVGLFGDFTLATSAAGSIDTSPRQPVWEAVHQPEQAMHGRKRKRPGGSDGSAKEEEIACTDDEMEGVLMGQETESAQQENHAAEDRGENPAKRQKRTLFDYLGLEMYSSD